MKRSSESNEALRKKGEKRIKDGEFDPRMTEILSRHLKIEPGNREEGPQKPLFPDDPGDKIPLKNARRRNLYRK